LGIEQKLVTSIKLMNRIIWLFIRYLKIIQSVLVPIGQI